MQTTIHDGDELNYEGTCSICGCYFNVAAKIDCNCVNDETSLEVPSDYDADDDDEDDVDDTDDYMLDSGLYNGTCGC